MDNFSGKAHVYGDNIDTDRIIPGKYTKTLDLRQLADHVLEDLDPTFSQRVQKGDILVAGYNFGAGSSREQAPMAIKAAGVSAVIAKSFARIFYRNAINIGLPLMEIADNTIENNNDIQIQLDSGRVINLTKDIAYEVKQMPNIMIQILNSGGLIQYLKSNKDYSID